MTRNVRRQLAEDGRMSLGERLPFPDGDRILKRYVRPPSSFQSFLLAWRRDVGAFRSVAPAARGDEVPQAGGSALGPRVEMVTMFRRTGTTAPETGLHLALALCPRHAFAALLAAEAPDRIAALHVPRPDYRRANGQDDGEYAGKRDGRQHAVEHPSKDGRDGRGWSYRSCFPGTRHERQDGSGEDPHRQGGHGQPE
jgi:hypothetical protein